jgi:hypothetical protein
MQPGDLDQDGNETVSVEQALYDIQILSVEYPWLWNRNDDPDLFETTTKGGKLYKVSQFEVYAQGLLLHALKNCVERYGTPEQIAEVKFLKTIAEIDG